MNPSAYLATGQMIALMESFSKIRVLMHGQEQIPDGSIIFVVNHFTRIETLLLPYHIYGLTSAPVWSLADHSFFEGPLSGFLEHVGAVSTRDPDRDHLIVKSLLTGEANWIIFPEGQMVKNKVAVSKPAFFGLFSGGTRSAHTGAATLALRTEFYRQRMGRLITEAPAEAERLQGLFQIDDLAPVLKRKTWLVPVNITYYPIRARENVLSALAERFTHKLSERLREELMTEGTMFFKGVDIDIRFGSAIAASDFLTAAPIVQDMYSDRQINFDDHLRSRPAMRREATRLMRLFMADIYGMTTVNHDHLFASLLRAMPFRKISEEDFRRRVFLLTELVPDKTLVFCHHSLEIGQVALLTDDRYHKYRDFLELALETGLIRREGDRLFKVSERFSLDGDFNRIRIDNPLGVVENEVQPLKALQNKVRWMAWQPEFMVRKQVRDTLLQRAVEEFEADYCRYCIPGETKDRDVGRPILLKGSSHRIGIVLLHGFLAAPREMLELATYLHQKGYWVYCVRLRGHGTSPEDLALRGSSDWIDSVDLGYALMNACCSRVVVGGFSLGGGLALDCAARIDRLGGVFAVSPPFRLHSLSSRFAPAITVWNRIMDTVHYQDAKKEFVENAPEHPQINYARIPVAGVAELERFMSELEPRLSSIRAPALMIQSRNDPVVDAESTEQQFKNIGTEYKTYIPFDFNRHGILAGEGADQVHSVIGNFIDGLRNGAH